MLAWVRTLSQSLIALRLERFSYSGGFAGPGPTSGPDVFSTSGEGRVTISHRNEDIDEPAAFNYTLESQGLASLVPKLQSSDRWRHRHFGFTVSGTASGAALTRKNASTLASTAAATSFEVTASTHAAQTESAEQWHATVHAQHDRAVGGAAHEASARQLAVAERSRAHTAWWESFWARTPHPRCAQR